MKAVLLYEHGESGKLVYEDVLKPLPGAKEVLVKVEACAMNHLDVWVRQGLPGVSFPLPMILGSDAAGVVSELGAGVDSVQIGAKVMIAPGLSCGHCIPCLSGADNHCKSYGILGENRNGTYAEYVSVPVQNLIPMPEHLSFGEAASIPLVFQTAWHMLVTRAQIKPGEDVLILGAGSGVGSAGIQIAKLFGARVITTVGHDEKIPKAFELGADHVIQHTKQDFAAEVRRITERKGVEVVFEHIGSATWEKSCRVLAHHGRLVICGATTGFEAKIDLRHLFFRQLSLLGSTMGSKGELLAMMPLFTQKRLRPVLDRVFPLSAVQEAHRYLEERKTFGKVVLTPKC